MLVDNDVERDSRVQKQARAMADAGWDVVLLGKAGPQGARRWKIGDARVRLVPTPGLLARRPGDLRGARLTSPLAYPAGWLADNRRQAVRARRADLRLRRITAAHPDEESRRRTAERLRLLGARAGTAALGKWVDLRAGSTDRLIQQRQQGERKTDRIATTLWEKAVGDRSWRRLAPHLWDYELAFGPEVDRLQPDLIHANDFHMLGVGARAKIRAREQGRDVRLVWDAHEFLPGIRPWEANPRWLAGQIAHEREYAPYADAVVTVSEELAELLQTTHGLKERPAVVLNTPYADEAAAEDGPSIRSALEVGPDVPVLVYSGSASPARGLDVMVEALPRLPDVVCALVVNKPESDYVRGLLARARDLGVADRVRLVPYVPYDQVVGFLGSADVGVIPIQHWPNHEIALITKFFEYSHARLPIVVSDVRAMAHVVERTGQGEVFTAGNLGSFVAAVLAVLDDPDRYRKAYDDPQLLRAVDVGGAGRGPRRRLLPAARSRPVTAADGSPDPARGPGDGAPDVTVVLAVYNTMPYLTRTLESVVGQSLGAERMEVVAVDDGSTDGSAEELDRFAAAHPGLVRVLHQENSGGPAGPCNRALDAARGRFVYFLGADDYLGDEALERMVAYADEHDADIVMGRVVGVNGRFIRQQVYRRNDPDLDRYGPDLRWSLANTNLYRRSLVERLGLRYVEGLPFGSDQPFMLEAVVNASRVSVLADYTCYYAVDRDERTNISYSTPYDERLRCIQVLVSTAAGVVPEGRPRDTVLVRHFTWEVPSLLRQGFEEAGSEGLQRACADVRAFLEEYGDGAILSDLKVQPRVVLRLAARGDCRSLERVFADDFPEHPPLVVLPSGVYVDLPGLSTDEPDPAYRVPDQQAFRVRLSGGLETVEASWAGLGPSRELVVHLATNLLDPERLATVTAVVRRPGDDRPVPDVTSTPSDAGVRVTVRVPAADLAGPEAERGGWRLRVTVAAGGFAVELPVPLAPDDPGRTRFWHAGSVRAAWVDDPENLVLHTRRLPLSHAVRAVVRRLPGRR